MVKPQTNRPVRWTLQVGGLVGASLLVFSAFYWADHHWFGAVYRVEPSGPLERFISFEPSALADAISSLAGVIAAVFGIVITVVSIIVQLAANRFSGVTRMFLRDRINQAVMIYYIVVCVCGVWLSPSLQSDYVPRAGLLGMLVMTSVGVALMAPYFGYVFWFLDPIQIIARIGRSAQRSLSRGVLSEAQGMLHGSQARSLSAMEELTDIAGRSISGKDKVIASAAVDALRDLALAYLKQKPKAGTDWFKVGPEIRGNPDFVSMDPESLMELEQRGTWVEWKVMRQYLGIYSEGLSHMRDINYLIAIDTRYIGEAAQRAADEELLQLVVRFMNSYLRATLNARDVRTAYNVMNQYRLLLECCLRNGDGPVALTGVRHLKYYGHVSFEQELPFVTETVAYDVSALCELAHSLGAEQAEAMLAEFLELDQPLAVSSQERGLLGVRKAQVKLACYYMDEGAERPARRIARDMAQEPLQRLRAIRHDLERVRSKDFWEINDRGRNFEFMTDERKTQLPHFFRWLGEGTTKPPLAQASGRAILKVE